MAKKSSTTLFRRLNRLFKGGPRLRKKISTSDTTMAVPDKTKSSGVLLFQKSMSPTYATITSNAYNLSERLMRYQDFQEMEYTPELASALDIYADESVPQDEKGRILHVYSENEKIKEILEDLFYNVLNVDFNLRPQVRNLVKYGDFFLYVDVSPEYGVMNAFPIPVNEIEREEGYDREDPFAVRFRWVTLGNRTLENWELAHFRLLGNDMFLPYGSSVVEPARRIWRQLILIEDAMLVYRVVRAPERRVFYIDVGNIPPDEIENYIEQQKHQLRSSQVIDRDTGKVDLRYNPLPVHKDTPIPLLDGRTVTIEQLAQEKECDPEKELWVYSVQDESQKMVPGKVTWCGKNYTAKKLVKVWLDDDTYVTTAPEHPFVLRDGSSKRADELIVGESLMPLYRKLSSKKDGFDIEGYETVYDPCSESYKFTHRIVANAVLSEQRENVRCSTDWTINKNLTVHHVDVNRLNNSPQNLLWIGNVDHIKLHAEQGHERLIAYNKSERKKFRVSERNKERNSVAAMNTYNGGDLHKLHNENRRVRQLKSWNEDAQSRKKAMRWVIPDEMFEFIRETVKQNPKWGRLKVHDAIVSNEQLMSAFVASQTTKRDVKKFSFGAWEGDLQRRGFEKLTGLRKSIVGYRNHKVKDIEILDVEGEDVYCMTVVGPNGEDDRHNFAVCGLGWNGVGDTQPAVIVKNSVDEDYFIPVRGQDSGTKIDTLAGGQNTAAVEDVEYIQKKMISALKIPRAYLGYDDMLSSKATLAQEDIRFARTINAIQKTVIAELNKIAIIHLYAHGYTNEDLMDFSIRLTSPSTVAEQQKLELWRSRFEIAGSAPEGMLKPEWLMKNILNMTDKEVRENASPGQVEGGGGAGGGGALGGGGFDLGGDEEGGDFDLGDTGGDFDLGDADDADTDDSGEDDEDLTSGVDPEEDEPEAELITSGEDQGKSDSTPIKSSDRTKHNRYVRRKAHGNADIHMPNFPEMMKPDPIGAAYDSDFFRTLGKNDTLTPISAVRETQYIEKTMQAVSPDMVSMLRRMSAAKIGPGVMQSGPQTGGVLHEGVDVQDEIDRNDDQIIEGLDIDWGDNK